MAELNNGLAAILRRHEARLLADWMGELAKSGRIGAIDKAELEEQARTFVRLLTEAAQADASEEVRGPLGEMLATCRARAPARASRRPRPRRSSSRSSSRSSRSSARRTAGRRGPRARDLERHRRCSTSSASSHRGVPEERARR